MLNKLKKNLIEYGHLAGIKGFSPGISGNLSARCDDGIIITASGCANEFLTDEDFSLIDLEGKLKQGNPKPSSEKFLHLEFYKQREDIQCIFHVHSPYLTAYASAGVALDEGISPEIIYCLDTIPLSAYALPGSAELVENTSQYFKQYDVILLANHGVIVGGSDVKDAYLKLELAEAYAKTSICAKILGGAKILTEEEIKKINLLEGSRRGKNSDNYVRK